MSTSGISFLVPTQDVFQSHTSLLKQYIVSIVLSNLATAASLGTKSQICCNYYSKLR